MSERIEKLSVWTFWACMGVAGVSSVVMAIRPMQASDGLYWPAVTSILGALASVGVGVFIAWSGKGE